MKLEVPSSADIWKSGGFSCAYILEYELPKAETGGNYSWETELSLRLPHGIMFAPDGSEPPGLASLVVFVIEDPEDKYSITGIKQPILMQRIFERLGEIPRNSDNGILVEHETSQDLRYVRHFNGNFAVAPGVTPRLFFAVSSQLTLNGGGQMCISWCSESPRPSMADVAGFEVRNTGNEPGVTVLTLNNP